MIEIHHRPLPQRERAAFLLKMSGLTFRRVGRCLGVSSTEAKKLFRSAESMLNLSAPPRGHDSRVLERRRIGTLIKNHLRSWRDRWPLLFS